jgi:hypothetical protein
MTQTIAAYVIVAAAAAFVVWRLFVPVAWKARLRALVRHRPAPPQDGCGCARDPL